MAIQDFENRELSVMPEAEVLLDETRKWAKFLAILGFIFCGLMVLVGLVFTMFIDTMAPEAAGIFPPVLMFVIYFLMALLYFFPSLYLYKFAERARLAIVSKNADTLTGAVSSLRDCFRYLGIVSIIVMIIYAIGFAIAFVSMLFFSDMLPEAYTLM
jgi:uncharacterized RDD family membrane protein YckC